MENSRMSLISRGSNGKIKALIKCKILIKKVGDNLLTLKKNKVRKKI